MKGIEIDIVHAVFINLHLIIARVCVCVHMYVYTILFIQ